MKNHKKTMKQKFKKMGKGWLVIGPGHPQTEPNQTGLAPVRSSVDLGQNK